MLIPHKLFDLVKKQNNLKSDKDLAVFLNTEPPYLSRMRTGKLKVSSTIILAVHETTGMPIAEIRGLLK